MSHYKPDPNKSVNLIIDGRPVTVPEGTTILEAAKKVNIHIPTLCNHPALERRAVCRLCVVECDGRSRLVAACANDVWEGANIVTTNARIVGIRRMIVELLLANHPPECLSCIRTTNCELQTLAATFGIRSSPFRRDAADRRLPVIDAGALVRDMGKCVKCGRCVEVCQGIQTVRAINSSRRSIQYEICTPYEQPLSGGPCIFCGQCAEVCPVGAIYEFDQTAEVRAALDKDGQHTMIQISAAAAAALGRELAYPAGTITAGKTVTALKRMGFDKVFDAHIFAALTIGEEYAELIDRINSQGKLQGSQRNRLGGNLQSKLPMIISCSPGWIKFTKEFYPDLMDHLTACKSPEQFFGSIIKGTDKSKITTVSVVPCIAKKYECRHMETDEDGFRNVDIALTVHELARMIRLAGIDFTNLPEDQFDEILFDNSKNKLASDNIGTILWKVYDAYRGGGTGEIEEDLQEKKINALLVDGLDNARKVMDAIRRGECNTDFIAVRSCPIGCFGNEVMGL